MTPQSKILEYAHHHSLTCDPEWTFDFAEELVMGFSTAFQLVPPSQSLHEDIKQTWSSLDLITAQAGQEHHQPLESIFLDNWLIPQAPITYARRFRDSVKSSQHLDLADSDWWGDGLFEPQLTHIMGDYILQRNRRHATISLQPDDSKTIKNDLSLDGQQTFNDVIVGEETHIHIPTPEELSDTAHQLSSSQYRKIKDIKLQREEIFGTRSPLIRMDSDLLELEETLPSETSRHAISPPLMPRQSSSSAELWHTQANAFVNSVIGSLQQEEIHQCSSPILSNDTWNDLDSFLRPSCTPPSSPIPSEDVVQKDAAIEFLSPSADPTNWDKVENLENPFETVLFSRTERMPLHTNRSTSFNLRNHWDMASCLFDEHQLLQASLTPEPAEGDSKEGCEGSFEILNQLVANRGWDNQRFEHQIFGSPGEAANLHTKLKRIPVEVPDAPISKHEIHKELLPSHLDEFRIQELDNSRPKNSSKISQGLQKVEGLKALNIELPWNAYNFLPSSTLEKLTDLGSKPVDEPSDVDSSSKDDSFISKRFKSEHNPNVADEPWVKLSDFLDQSSSESGSYYSQHDSDRTKEPDTLNDGAVSTSDFTRRSTSPTTRTDEDLKPTSVTESTEPPNNSSQTNPLETEYFHQGYGLQSDFGSANQSSAQTEDDKFIDLLGLRSVDPSPHDIQNHGFYRIWST
ncbi:hypothetical protein, variant 1 [Puccinia triticina 1-1 BBBD Race 1]|uniref:Uncharacterized protein n=2 Tax=Puccinia triticina TaxID=208348 RepID=A0A180GCT6_PUCT1|nr:uncharacterized protein PtA15_1A47 [Puccinia triticina]OAV90507.1 hypothetical protein, variant 1 [Puccinia triticina 1-1 BBBD Race 1]WAQ80709.1 hypothetical protein PtA15_1A47 [Puccinia triticina]WAR51601.1 hypothetical protein PtB15_1B37 [Puccinia triticina]